ncbi:MAG: metalloregulator ArsR/SmtB family transcription factor [Anaerolineales bacterium]|nr:metalloregulator ArsR/SmtB family transcription factor [Anaerolineales bacterium]
MQGYERSAQILKAVGHPIRLQILETLGLEGEACVCHLENVLGQRQAYLSQQLAKLREAGLVSDRRDGLNIFYSLEGPYINDIVLTAREAAKASSQKEGRRLRFVKEGVGRKQQCLCPSCTA